MHVARCHDLPVYAPMLWISTAFLAGAMINRVQWWNKKTPTWLTVSVASRFAAIFGVKRSFSFYWLQQLISEPGLKCGKLAELFLLWLVRFHFQVGFGLVSGGFRVFPATETFELLFSRQMMQSAPDEGDQNILECIWSTQDLYCNVGSFKLIQGPLPVVGDLALVFKKSWQTCQILLLGISWDARSAVKTSILCNCLQGYEGTPAEVWIVDCSNWRKTIFKNSKHLNSPRAPQSGGYRGSSCPSCPKSCPNCCLDCDFVGMPQCFIASSWICSKEPQKLPARNLA